MDEFITIVIIIDVFTKQRTAHNMPESKITEKRVKMAVLLGCQ